MKEDLGSGSFLLLEETDKFVFILCFSNPLHELLE